MAGTTGSNVSSLDERRQSPGDQHPRVTLQDVCSRPRPHGHVVVFANEKGGVGKSTLAFHAGVALSNAGYKVAVVDLDKRQQSLSQTLDRRDGTARSLQVDLPCPAHVVLERQSGAQLSQEIARIGPDCDFVVIDVAGHDSPVARYAMAMADTLVTPVNCSFIDLELLGKFNPVTRRLKEPGHFAQLVTELREARADCNMPPLDWIVMKNRARRAEKRQQMHVDEALRKLAPEIGFRLAEGLSERVVYRELLPFGLTHLDLKFIPGLARIQVTTEREIHRLMADLALPTPALSLRQHKRERDLGHVARKTSEAFGASLYAHMNPNVASISRTG